MNMMIGFKDALELVQKNVPRGKTEEVGLLTSTGRVLAEDAIAKVDSPSLDISLKDGYAVYSADVALAKPDKEVALPLAGFQAAGDLPRQALEQRTAIRITSGAPVPPGAEAVLALEFTREADGKIWCFNNASSGRNILPRATDVKAGETIARQGERLHPALIGLLAAAGLDRVRVASRPRVAVIATGDEVLAPGQPLTPGKVYASNMVETICWLKSFDFPDLIFRILPDREEEIAAAIQAMLPGVDAFITSGGAWQSERDLIIQVLEGLGWHEVFHRVRLGPGKAVGFGRLEERPFFILPGGPPSHEIAFLLLALPGLLAMIGWREPVFPAFKVRLEGSIRGQADWTQVIYAQLTLREGSWRVSPFKFPSRLFTMARKEAVIILHEGVSEAQPGDEVEVRLLSIPRF